MQYTGNLWAWIWHVLSDECRLQPLLPCRAMLIGERWQMSKIWNSTFILTALVDGWMNQAYSRLSTTHGHITDCKLLVCMDWTRLVLVRPAASLYTVGMGWDVWGWLGISVSGMRGTFDLGTLDVTFKSFAGSDFKESRYPKCCFFLPLWLISCGLAPFRVILRSFGVLLTL